MQLQSNQESNGFSPLFWEQFPIQKQIQHGFIFGMEKGNMEHKRIMLSILNHYITERGSQNDTQANDLLFFDYEGDVAPFVEQTTSLLHLKPQVITSPISSDVDVYQGIQSAIGNGTLLFFSTHLSEEYKNRLPFIYTVQYYFLQMVIRLHELSYETASVKKIGEFILSLKNGDMQPLENLLEVLHSLHGELPLYQADDIVVMKGDIDEVAEATVKLLQGLFGKQDNYFATVQELSLRNVTKLIKRLHGDDCDITDVLRALREPELLKQYVNELKEKVGKMDDLVCFFENELLGKMEQDYANYVIGIKVQLEKIISNMTEKSDNEKELLASTLNYFKAEVHTALAVCHEVFNVVEKILENEKYLKIDNKYNYFFFDHVSGIDRHPFIVQASATSQKAVANQYLASFLTNVLCTRSTRNDKKLQGVTHLFIRLDSLSDIWIDKVLIDLLNRAVTIGAINSLQIWFITNDESLSPFGKEMPILIGNVRNRYDLSTHEGV